MSRQFPGYFLPPGPAPHPNLSYAPAAHLRGYVMLGRRRIEQSFMLDTGADHTILQAEAGQTLLGDWYNNLSSIDDKDLITMTGVGSTAVTCLVHRVGLQFRDTDGEPLRFPQTVLIAEPVRNQRVIWQMPSLLGRDLLTQFELNLSYDPPSVSLTLK